MSKTKFNAANTKWENNTSQNDLLLEYAEHLKERAIFSGKTASMTAGSVTRSQGLKKYRLKDEHGVEEEFEVPLPQQSRDVQSGPVPNELHESTPVDRRNCDQRVRDQALSVESRLEALREYINADYGTAAMFVAEQLQSVELAPEWLRIVIYAAEDLRFEDPAVRYEVGEALLDHALSLRQSTSTADVPVVMSAIRRAGSLLPESRLASVLPLLEGGTAIDTRLVTLQALTRVFVPAPPQDVDALQPLANRAALIASKHWDLDVFKAGEISAIAIEATLLSALIGASKAVNCAEMAKATKRRLLVRKLVSRLHEVQKNWLQHGPTETLSNLDRVLVSLQDQEN